MSDASVETGENKEVASNSLWTNTTVLLALFTLLYLLMRLPWVFTLPGTEAPDEGNHFWVSHFLTTHLRLPSGQEVLSAGGTAEYGSLPQFGYLPNALCSLLANESNMPTISRLGSVIAGLPTMFAAYFIGKEIFPTSRFKTLALTLLTVLHPQLVFTQSYTSTDATTVSLASVSILLIVKAIKHGLTVRASLILGFLLGWMALSKHTGLSIVPAIGLGMVAATFGRGEAISSALTKIGAAIGVFSATCGWWFYRNYFEFNGDILGSRTMYETWSKILPKENGVIVHPWPQVHQLGWWRYVFFDFFGLFGYMNRYIYRPAYIVYFLYFLAAIGGWFKFAFAKPNKASAENFNVAENSETAQNQKLEKLIWFIFLMCPLMNLAAMILATLMKVTGPHGRYLFPSIVPIDAMLIAGFYHFGERTGKWMVVTLLTLHLAVTVGSWLVFYAPR